MPRDSKGRFTRHARRRSRAMAPRRSRRRWSPFRRFRRHKKARKIPILPLAGIGVSLTQSSGDGWASPLAAVETGNAAYIVQTLANHFANVKLPIAGGYTSGPIQFDPMQFLNPFDLNHAPGFKYALWGAVASMVCKWVGITRRIQPYMNKLPIVKKFTL